jgi:3-oxoadipate enol-lactonase
MAELMANSIRLHVDDDDFVEPWRIHGTVVLLHGFCRNGRFWNSWVPYLGHDYRVVRPDLRGCGLSADPGQTYEYSLPDLSSDLLAVLDQLGLKRVHFVGESLGCVVGLAVAVKHPERFISMSLLHTVTKSSESARSMNAAGSSSWQAALRELGVERWWLRARTAAGDIGSDGDAHRFMAREAGRTPIHVAEALVGLATAFDIRELLPDVKTPTRFFSSRNYSYYTSEEQQRELCNLTPNSSLILCNSQARSYFPFTDVASVAPQVVAFMNDINDQQNTNVRPT